MPSQLRTALLIFLGSITAPVVAEEPWKPAKLWIAGTDNTTWVAGRNAGSSGLPIVQLWFSAKDNVTPAQSLYLPPVSGDPLQIVADTQALRVLYGNLTACDYFGDRPYSPGTLWRGECRGRPLAWGGDATMPIIWALVATEQLEKPATTDDNSSDIVVRPIPRTRLTLLKLQSGQWTRHDGPDIPAGASAHWITSRAGSPRAFWIAEGKLYTARRAEDVWSKPQEVPTESADLRYGWAGTSADGAAFIVGKRLDANRYELHLLLEKSGVWSDAGAVREGNESLILDPETAGIGIARGQLAVARPTATGEVEFGTAALGVSPAMRFNTLSISRADFQPQSQWGEAFTLALCLVVMTIAMWTRRDLAVQVLPLPKGLRLAMVWKRVIAGLIDMVPAILITLPWWYPKIVALGLEGRTSFTTEELILIDNQTTFERYATYAAYGLWCFIWELFLARTPGKLILGIRVISIDGSHPGLRQCFLRNAVRTLMVALGATGFLVTIMSIVIVTRNRQRTGDLLAQTLVVEPGEPPPLVPEPQEDDRMGPFD